MIIKFINLSLVTYFICNFIEYGLHKLSHNPKIPLLYKWHHYHHTHEFPPYKLVNNNHINKSIIYNYYVYIVLLIHLLTYCLISSIQVKLIIYVESTIYMYIANKMHNSYHKDDTWLEQFQWFQRKKSLHLYHHIKTTSNFNLFDNTTDKLKKTFKRCNSI